MMRAWLAFKNMLRAAAHDPLWALMACITGILSGGVHVFVSIMIAFLVSILLFAGLAYGLDTIGMGQSWLHDVLNIVVVGVIVWLLARLMLRPMMEAFGTPHDDETHGSARFASDKESAALTMSKDGLLIGRNPKSGKLLRYDGPAHLLTIAPTRTGKGVGTIIPNLLTADRSVICIDPKGENASIAGRARETFGKVFYLDPFGVTGRTSSAFNPLNHLDPDGLDGAEDAASLADSLVYDPPGEAGEAHWNEEAKALIGGLLLHIAAEEPRERRNLATLREYLTLAPDAFLSLLKRMQATKTASGLIARAANRHLGKSDREASGVLSAAQRHTHFLDSPRMTAVMARSEFSFADLKSRIATVFLVLPPDRLGAYARWLRLLIACSLQDMARTPQKPPAPVLYLLDEFAALGRLEPVERAMGLMAGYGVQLWPILQDIHQLRAAYGQRAGTFISNTGVLQVFGVNDHDSARLVSDLLGQETIVFQTMSRALDAEATGITHSEQHVGRALLTPDEVRTLPQNAELLFLAGQRPVLAKKLRYFEDHEFEGMFDPA